MRKQESRDLLSHPPSQSPWKDFCIHPPKGEDTEPLTFLTFHGWAQKSVTQLNFSLVFLAQPEPMGFTYLLF